jgi:hypothetical protein
VVSGVAKDSYPQVDPAYELMARHFGSCTVCGDEETDEVCNEGEHLRSEMSRAFRAKQEAMRHG